MKVNKRLRHFHDSPTPSEILGIEGELYECVFNEQILNKNQKFS